MKKFTFLYMGILAVFIVVGIGMIFFSEKDDGSLEIDEKQLSKTPGLNTMLAVNTIIKEQQLEDYLIDIQVAQENELDFVTVELQGNDFVTADTLLKDSYNIYSSSADLKELSGLSIIWHSSIEGTNEKVLTIYLTKDQITKLKTSNYTEISSIATTFEQHPNFN